MKDCRRARLSPVRVVWAAKMLGTIFVQQEMRNKMVPCMPVNPPRWQNWRLWPPFELPLCRKDVAYGHTTGNTPEPVGFQKLSPVRPS